MDGHRSTTFKRSEPSSVTGLCVLLIEDDRGDAILVEDLLVDAAPNIELVHVATLAEARDHLPGRVDCVLVDLGLPDASGLSALEAVRQLAPDTPVLVLTGLDDTGRGLEAVTGGAQDYLIKGHVDGQAMARSIRYAIERRRSEIIQGELQSAQLLMAENARLERGLLPVPVLADDRVQVTATSRPGRERALLGGDFYDVVQCPDGRIHLLIGDVCGHGADEAALGVCLRVAWRALVLAGREPEDVLRTLEQVLIHERQDAALFATACHVALSSDYRQAGVWSAGHPPPLVLEAEARPLEVRPRPPLGLWPDGPWPCVHSAIGPGATLLLMTDGIFEGRAAPGSEDRLGDEAFTGLVTGYLGAHDGWREATDMLIADLIAEVQRRNGGELTDDLALITLRAR